MNTKKLEKAVKETIEQEVVEAISEVDLSYYINKKVIKGWVERVVRDHIAMKARDVLELKIMRELRKYDLQLDTEIQRMVFEEVSKHLKV